MDNKFEVIIDTREQNGWDFTPYDNVKNCISAKLETGDYAIRGLEDILCIERKASVGELAGSITQDRFKKEIERMGQFPHAFLMLEFSMTSIENYPVGSGVPKKVWDKIKVKGPFILGFLDRLQLDHNIHVLFCDNRVNAQARAYKIMEKCQKRYTQ